MFRFFKLFYTGLKSLITAFSFIFKHNFWLYYLIPIVLMLLLYTIGKFIFDEMVSSFDFNQLKKMDYTELFGSAQTQPFLILGLELILVYILVNFSTYVVLIILTPLLTIISAQTDYITTGYKRKSTIKIFLNDIWNAMSMVVRNLAINLFWVAVWYAFSLILLPFEEVLPLSLINQIAVLCIGFYFYGFSLIDYTSERHNLSIEQRIAFVRKNTGLAIALGAFYSLVFKIPYGIGVVIGPITAVVAATIAIRRLYPKINNAATT